MISDVKVDLRRKARLVIGSHIVNSSGKEVYVITMKSVSARIPMTIAAANNLDIMKGDIGNAFINGNAHENIYTCAGTSFELMDIMDEGNFLQFIKAIYGLPTSRNRWHTYLLHTLTAMGFKPTRFNPYALIRGRKGGYKYIGTHTDDVFVVAVNPTSIFDKLKETYTIKDFVPLKVHLGCAYTQVRKGATTMGLWVALLILQNFLGRSAHY